MRIRPFVALVMLFALIILPIGCSHTPDTQDGSATTQSTEETSVDTTTTPVEDAVDVAASDVIVRVNGQDVLEEAFERAKDAVIVNYQQIYSQFGQDVRDLLNGADGRVFELGIGLEAVDVVTYRALIKGKLREQGITITDEAVNEETNRQFDDYLTTQDMTREQFETMLEAQSYTMEEMLDNVRKSIRDQMELDAAERAIAGELDYTEDDLLAYFDEHRDDYAVEEQVKAAHILVATEADAQQILDELADGADFAELATTRSIDTGSAVRGGSLGWFGRGMMVPEFEDAAFALEVGEISGIVQTDYGFHIIKLLDDQPAEDPDFEKSRDQVVSDYEQSILDSTFRTWYTEAKAEADVEITDPLLKAYRDYKDDPDTGFEGLLNLRAAGTIDDPVLNYFIGTVYQERYETALSRREELEVEDSSDPAVAEELSLLATQIPEYRANAIESLRAAAASYGDSETSIQQRIQSLEDSSDSSDGGTTTDSSADDTDQE